MPQTTADPPDPSCSSLFSKNGIERFQSFDPDRFLSRAPARAREMDGRFAKGHSGNPCGRPRGIPNPRRRIPNLRAKPLGPEALSALLDRKPHLLLALAAQVLPPPSKPLDPAERLGIDLSAVRTPEDLQHLVRRVLAAVSHGDIAPAEAARLVRRGRTRLRALRGLARLRRRVETSAACVGRVQPGMTGRNPPPPVAASASLHTPGELIGKRRS